MKERKEEMVKKIVAMLLAGGIALSGFSGSTVYAGVLEEETEGLAYTDLL